MFGHCSFCLADRPFEQPPCDCGRGVDCPEWMCTECGAALLVGGSVGPAPAPSAGGHENNAGNGDGHPEHLHAA